jgi:hypothetical protein
LQVSYDLALRACSLIRKSKIDSQSMLWQSSWQRCLPACAQMDGLLAAAIPLYWPLANPARTRLHGMHASTARLT